MNPAIVAGLITAGGGLLDRILSKGDINAQNRYNSPKMQVARLREAGLPMSAMGGGNPTGQQSALPEKSQGAIGKFITTQMELKQLEILKADARVKNAEADKYEAEAAWWLRRRGSDAGPDTNLTNNLQMQQQMQQTQVEGSEINNTINRLIAKNTEYRQGLENTKLVADIGATLANAQLIQSHKIGADIENDIKSVILEYQPQMSNAELEGLLKKNNLINENITGAKLDNALGEIRNRIAVKTEDAEVNTKNIQSFLHGLSYDRVQAEFKNYQQYQEFVDAMQDILRSPGKQGLFKTMDGLVKFLYTSVAAPSGQVSGQILSGIGGANGTFETGNKYIHIHND